MKICDILKEDKIIADFSGKTKEEVINQLIDLFQKDTRVNNLEKIRTAVLEREKIMSTGVGNGFAIPHGKTEGVNEIIAGFARIPETIDFQALDDKPVNLVFLLVGKENLVGPHIKLLSRISRMMNKEQFRNDLLAADTPAKIYEIFQNEEKNYFDIT